MSKKGGEKVTVLHIECSFASVLEGLLSDAESTVLQPLRGKETSLWRSRRQSILLLKHRARSSSPKARQGLRYAEPVAKESRLPEARMSARPRCPPETLRHTEALHRCCLFKIHRHTQPGKEGRVVHKDPRRCFKQLMRGSQVGGSYCCATYFMFAHFVKSLGRLVGGYHNSAGSVIGRLTSFEYRYI